MNLFIGSDAEVPLESGKASLSLRANYPADGTVRISVRPEHGGQEFTVAVRKPAFSKSARVTVNGEEVSAPLQNGYLFLTRAWNGGDEITVTLDVSFRFVHCNPRTRDNIGKVCLMKGPWVYCLEEKDNGKYLSSIRIDTEIPAKQTSDPSLPGGLVCAQLHGDRIDYAQAPEHLYGEEKPVYTEGMFRALPYCYWNNRGKGEMLVWMREKESR